MKRYLTCLSVFPLFALLAGASTSLFAQPPGPGEGGFKGFGQADGSRIIQKLNRALEAAGGEGLLLRTEQEDEIAALLETQRANRPKPDPENRGDGSMKAYAAEILSENPDLDVIEQAANDIANGMADRTARRLIAQANFQIALLGVLDGGQIGALQAQFGERGLLRLLNSRGRRGGKMGRGGRGGESFRGLEGFSRERTRVAPRGEVTGP